MVTLNIANLINTINNYIESSNYSLRVKEKNDYFELDIVANEDGRVYFYESVRIYDDGFWTGVGLLTWIRNYLDDKFNLDEIEND